MLCVWLQLLEVNMLGDSVPWALEPVTWSALAASIAAAMLSRSQESNVLEDHTWPFEQQGVVNGLPLPTL